MKRYILTLAFFTFSLFFLQGQEKGKASYYSNYFHNKKTASGTVYHKDSLVCAHKKHSFGTLLKVKNVKNAKEVIVKVIDRGPFVKGRIIDLSLAAAREIDMVRAGVAVVEVIVVDEDIK